jgi:hypothetical protein
VPITIGLPPPGDLFGPGIRASLTTSFVGPFPTGTTWALFASRDSEGEQLLTFDSVPWLSPLQAIDAGSPATRVAVAQTAAVIDGANAFLNAQVIQPPSTVADSGQIPIRFSNEVGLQTQIPQWSQPSTEGGLTDAQAIQLTETHASTFTDQLVDNLTLIPLTSTPSPGPVNANLLDTTFGVIVRLATVPADLVPQTPDGDYWIATLAVVRVFRGSDLWKRYPIHTSSRLISFLDESVVASVTALTATQWLLNMTMQVTFKPGVTGQVFLMRFP